jgi:transposase
LGKLDLEPKQLKGLANRIEEILTGQRPTFPIDQEMEKQALHFASLVRKQRLERFQPKAEDQKGTWQTVDLNSLKSEDVRTVGAEVVGAWAYERLGMTKILRGCGFNETDIARTKVLILGKLINPGSEREIHQWFHQRSALQEVMGIKAKHVSLSSLYRTCDRLVSQKEAIEESLVERERSLFGLGEKLILYDLTNTYFEGNPRTEEAQRGASKEKRTDRPLVTLGIVLDEDGFPKTSKVFPGNVSEPGTLEAVVDEMVLHRPRQLPLANQKPTVVMDAGIATEANLAMLRAKGLDYVCVDRRRLQDIPEGDPHVVHDGPSGIVKAIRSEDSSEVFLFCESTGRRQKEESIKNRFQIRFEQDLQRLADSLEKKGGIKKYEKVLERIGRLKEKYRLVARFYEIHVEEEDGKAVKLSWELKDEAGLEKRFSGRYRLRSSRTDLSDKELWDLYNMLTQVEASFRSLKHELLLRPVYHRVSRRIQGHLFVTVLAYHLLCVIQRTLRESGIRHHWATLRTHLSGQVRVTTSMVNDKGQAIHIRHTSEPEPVHVKIYNALGLPVRPLRRLTVIE